MRATPKIALVTLLGCATGETRPAPPSSRQVIVFVWDGLRPDSISAQTTPALAALRARGVDFTDHHATYPTFTMMNGASLATGHFPDQTGFYGNALWAPDGKGKNSAGATVSYRQPVFTEDYAVLRTLKALYGGKLLLAPTLFEAAHRRGLTTAAVGKSGPVFLQDAAEEGGLILDERVAAPLAFARELQAAGFALPRTTAVAYPGVIAESRDPTAIPAVKKLKDGLATDPPSDDTALTRQHDANEYLMKVFAEAVLPKKPALSLLWLRNPDAAEHDYGPGSASYRRALRSQDLLLERLVARLRELDLDRTTDVIVVSDHGHSTVSGPFELFPLRFLTGDVVDASGASSRAPGAVVPDAVLAANPAAGWSVSGEVRLAELLARNWQAYDGLGCLHNPVLSGVDRAGKRAAPDRVDAGLCGGKPFVTRDRLVPEQLSQRSIVIAANGGSDYLYFPDADPQRRAALAKEVVRFLQSRAEVGAIFVAKQYGELPGTLPLTAVRLESTRATPDVVLSYQWDDKAVVQGVPGTVHASLFTPSSNRGMHGSFSPADVHNTLIAAGPGFKRGYRDPLPTGNVDVAPTVARLLGLPLPGTAGRPLLEALADGSEAGYAIKSEVIRPAPATGLTIVKDDGSPDPADSYTIELAVKTLSGPGGTFRYFDFARAVRFKQR